MTLLNKYLKIIILLYMNVLNFLYTLPEKQATIQTKRIIENHYQK